MALRLGAPTSVECISQEGRSDIYFPANPWSFRFSGAREMPPVKIFWYDAMRDEQPTFGSAAR